MMTKRMFSSFGLLLLVALAVSGCSSPGPQEFAIYLLKQDMPMEQVQRLGLDALELQKQPIIATQDIVAYSRATHEMELTATAYERVTGLFSVPVDVDGMPFVVCVGRERIYTVRTPSNQFDGSTRWKSAGSRLGPILAGLHLSGRAMKSPDRVGGNRT